MAANIGASWYAPEGSGAIVASAAVVAVGSAFGASVAAGASVGSAGTGVLVASSPPQAATISPAEVAAEMLRNWRRDIFFFFIRFFSS
jgi:hypothetical protein